MAATKAKNVLTKKKTTSKRKKKKIAYKVGDILEVESFAGPKIYKRVTELVNDTSTYTTLGEITVKGFWGSLTRRKDLYALKKHCVPYTGKEKLYKTRSFTYDWQILRVVKNKKSCKNEKNI